MQFIWISGPVGRIRSVEVTAKRLWVTALIVLAIVVVLVTSLNLAGARAFFNINPELVQKLGGIVTAAEQEARESEFNSEIAQVRLLIKEMEQELKKAEEYKNRLQSLISRDPRDSSGRRDTQGVSGNSIPNDSKLGGRGGPFIPGDAKSPPRSEYSVQADQVAALATVSGRAITPELRRLSARAEELRASTDKLTHAWSNNFDHLSALPLAVPVDRHRAEIDVSSIFGFRKDPFNGQRAFHAGIDFSAPPGTPVYATADGVVVEVSNSPGYGRTIIIEHASGLMTLYAHLSSIRVKEGDRVKRHSVIGGIGSTGRSTGPHLHYEVLSKTRVPLNPRFFLSAFEN